MSKSGASFKSVLFSGLLVTLPLVFTLFLLHFLFVKLDNLLGPWVTLLLIKAGYELDPNVLVPGVGIISIVLIVFLVGLFTRNIVGRTVVNLYESILTKIPVLKNVYVGAKQVIETFGHSVGGSFNKVIMIEYPRKGIYALAFITSKSKGEVERITDRDMVNVFLPTTPNPTSGFFLLVPKEEIVELEMSVEEGIKMIISGGLVTPPDPELIKSAKDALQGEDGQHEFQNMIIDKPLSEGEMKKMARGHEGVIKIVVDISNGAVAAGAKWHSHSRDLLVRTGSNPDSCWGAKLDIYSGDLIYESQINKEKPENNSIEIEDSSIKAILKGHIDRLFPIIAK